MSPRSSVSLYEVLCGSCCLFMFFLLFFRLQVSFLALVLSPASTFFMLLNKDSCCLEVRCIQIPLFLVGGRTFYVYTHCSLWVWIRSLCLSILLSKHLTLPAMMARTLGLCFLPSPPPSPLKPRSLLCSSSRSVAPSRLAMAKTSKTLISKTKCRHLTSREVIILSKC